jgi:hypothetical protein
VEGWAEGWAEVKTKGFIKPLALGRMGEGEGSLRYGRMGGRRVRLYARVGFVESMTL